MKLTDRSTRVLWVEGSGLLVADIHGGLHLLDQDFEVQQSRRHPTNVDPIYAITIADGFVYTKDLRGNISKWRLSDLALLDTLAAQNLRGDGDYAPGEQASTVINRGICVWRDRLYVNNGYLELVEIDATTMEVFSIRPSFSTAWLEWFCTDRPGQQAVTDKQGNLFMGDLATQNFAVQVSLDDEQNLHRVVFDPRHDRYWVTQDAGAADDHWVANGIIVVNSDGIPQYDFKFATDDVEVLVFSPDFSRVYVGGFDGYIAVFDNTEVEPRQLDSIRGFRHQIIDMTVLPTGELVVLCQDGEMYKVDPTTAALTPSGFPSRCIWDLQADPLSSKNYLAATDQGVTLLTVAAGETVQPAVIVHDRLIFDFGFIRRVRPLSDGSFVAIGRNSVLFRADRSAKVLWSTTFQPNVHDISVSPDERMVVIASNEGVFEVDLSTGNRLRQFPLSGAVAWSCIVAPDGSVVIGMRNGLLASFDPQNQVVWSSQLDGYCKRMRLADAGTVLITGGGFKAVLVDLTNGKTERQWVEGTENTVENAIEINGRLYCCAYGLRLAVYDYESGEHLGAYQGLEDFPKALASYQVPGHDALLLVGGRGGFLEVRRIDESGDPLLVRTVHV